MNSQSCPCGSGHTYRRCCEPCHLGAAPAATPEALMRSRYSAFALGLAPYLLATWHSSTRPGNLNLSDSPQWQALHIFSAQQQGNNGQVEFRAIYKTADGLG
ncbi:MAG TPA: YchJ family metal-binding protein, partial [Cellvibrionaceae bacterium]